MVLPRVPIPVAVVIEYLEDQPDLMAMISSQIAGRHKFDEDTGNGGWSITNPALTVRADGGPVSNYVPDQKSRLEFLAWAKDFETAYFVYNEIVAIVRDFQRTPVGVGNLLLSLTFETLPTELVDPETNFPQLMFFVNAMVAENVAA